MNSRGGRRGVEEEGKLMKEGRGRGEELERGMGEGGGEGENKSREGKREGVAVC